MTYKLNFFRHECQQGDNLKKYGWLEHDGVNFGLQEIEEVDFKITTSFVKRQGGTHGGDWTARVQLEPLVRTALINENYAYYVVVIMIDFFR